jgi:hypothetical protein
MRFYFGNAHGELHPLPVDLSDLGLQLAKALGIGVGSLSPTLRSGVQSPVEPPPLALYFTLEHAQFLKRIADRARDTRSHELASALFLFCSLYTPLVGDATSSWRETKPDPIAGSPNRCDIWVAGPWPENRARRAGRAALCWWR